MCLFGAGRCECTFICIACMFLFIINTSYIDNHMWPYLMLHSSLWYGDITTGQVIYHTLCVLPCPHTYIQTQTRSYWSALTAAAHRLIINISWNHLSVTFTYTHVRQGKVFNKRSLQICPLLEVCFYSIPMYKTECIGVTELWMCSFPL